MVTGFGSTALAENDPGATVVVVDDDPLIRGAMDMLFRSVGYRTIVYGSARDVLDQGLPAGRRCLVVDIRMPEIGGLEFQTRLAERGVHVPIIFMTGHGDISMSVRAMKAGAVDFLPKPFHEQDMLDAVGSALERDRERATDDVARKSIQARFDKLTMREQQVMILVTSGLMNKQIAGELGISIITVKLHRGTMMTKMDAKTFADLVKSAEAIKLSRADMPAIATS